MYLSFCDKYDNNQTGVYIQRKQIVSGSVFNSADELINHLVRLFQPDTEKITATNPSFQRAIWSTNSSSHRKSPSKIDKRTHQHNIVDVPSDRYIIGKKERASLHHEFFNFVAQVRVGFGPGRERIIRSTSIHIFRLGSRGRFIRGDYGVGNEPFTHLISVASGLCNQNCRCDVVRQKLAFQLLAVRSRFYGDVHNLV